MENTPHHDHAAEAAVLGAIMLHVESFDRVLDVGLTVDAFHLAKHRATFAAMEAVAPEIDIVRVGGALSAEDIERVGGWSWLSSLGSRCPSIKSAPEYAATILRHASARRLRGVLVEATERIDDGGALDAITAETAEGMDAAVGVSRREKWHTPEEDASDLIARLNNPGQRTILTGFPALDEQTGGFARGDLVIIAGRPSMGKSAFAYNVCDAVARRGQRVAAFSLEVTRDKVWVRRVSSRAEVNSMWIRDHMNDRRALGPEERERVHVAASELASEPMYIDDRRGVSVAYMAAACRRLRRRYGALDLIVVDYLQLATGSGDSREQEISSISRALKTLAGEEDCPVIALSQLNRKLESRTDKRPMMSDLRESGAIEQDADVIAFVYRHAVYVPECDDPEVAEIIVRKQRDGTTGPIHLRWNAKFVRFESAPPRWMTQ